MSNVMLPMGFKSVIQKIRSVIVMLVVFFCLKPVYAFDWQDLWVTKNHQAMKLMKAGNFKKAIDVFKREDWQATAAFRAGQYEKAATLFSRLENTDGFYNQANAQAYMQHYAAAIQSYDRALALNPNHKDALYNRKIVAALLKQQQEQNSKSQNQNQQKQDKQKSEENKSAQTQQPNKSEPNDNQTDSEQKNANQPEQPQQEQNKEKQENKKQHAEKPLKKNITKAQQEQQQANEQWLRLIPDDPGGLLREKFLRDYLRREQEWHL